MGDERAEKLRLLKSSLIGLVISSQVETDLNVLRKDYAEYVTGSIPFWDFNYRDLNTFLREQCDDLFVFKGTFHNPILVPKVKKQTEHLDKLVLRTRNNKIRGRKRDSFYETSTPEKKIFSNDDPPVRQTNGHREQSAEMPSCSTVNTWRSCKNLSPKTSEIRPQVQVRQFYPQVQQKRQIAAQVRQVMDSTPQVQLERESAPQVRQVRDSVPQVRLERKSASQVRQVVQYEMESVPQRNQERKTTPQIQQAGSTPDNYIELNSERDTERLQRQTLSTQLVRNVFNRNPSPPSQELPVNSRSDKIRQVFNNKQQSEAVSCSLIPNSINIYHNKINSKPPEPVITNGNVAKREIFNRNDSSLSFKDDSCPTTSMDFNFGDNDGDVRISSGMDNSIPSSSGSQSITRKQKRYNDLVRNFGIIASKYPSGIWASEFNTKYKEMFGSELNYMKMGFQSINSMCESFPECWRVYTPVKFGESVLVDARPHCSHGSELNSSLDTPLTMPSIQHEEEQSRKEGLSTTKMTDRPDEAVHRKCTLLPEALPGIEFESYPPDSVTFYDTIDNLELPPLYRVIDAMIDIQVAEISDPTHFWYQIHSSRHTGLMNKMMADMTTFYNSPLGAQYAMMEGAVRPGLYCAALYEREWNRAIILKECSPKILKVRHIDFATAVPVDIKDVRFLKREWAALPAQALRGRLANIKPYLKEPPSVYWPAKCTDKFVKLVFERDLVASVCHYDETEKVLSMFLTDTTTKTDMHINDELVKQGLALVYDEMGDETADSERWTCRIHTYESLELGDSMPFSEIKMMEENNIAIDDDLSYVPQVEPLLLDLSADESQNEERTSSAFSLHKELLFEDCNAINMDYSTSHCPKDTLQLQRCITPATDNDSIDLSFLLNNKLSYNRPISPPPGYTPISSQRGSPSFESPYNPDIDHLVNLASMQSLSLGNAQSDNKFPYIRNVVQTGSYPTYHKPPNYFPQNDTPGFDNSAFHYNPFQFPNNSQTFYTPGAFSHMPYEGMKLQEPVQMNYMPSQGPKKQDPTQIKYSAGALSHIPITGPKFQDPSLAGTFSQVPIHGPNSRGPSQINYPPGHFLHMPTHGPNISNPSQIDYPPGMFPRMPINAQSSHAPMEFPPRNNYDFQPNYGQQCPPTLLNNTRNSRPLNIVHPYPAINPHKDDNLINEHQPVPPSAFSNNINVQALPNSPGPVISRRSILKKPSTSSASLCNGFWDANVTKLVPKTLPENSDSLTKVATFREKCSTENRKLQIRKSLSPVNVKIPPCDNILPLPDQTKIGKETINLFTFKNNTWISAMRLMQFFWNSDEYGKLESIEQFRIICASHLTSGAFDLHSIFKDQYNRLLYKVGFLELKPDELLSCKDVLLPVGSIKSFMMLFNFRLDLSLTELNYFAEEVLKRKI